VDDWLIDRIDVAHAIQLRVMIESPFPPPSLEIEGSRPLPICLFEVPEPITNRVGRLRRLDRATVGTLPDGPLTGLQPVSLMLLAGTLAWVHERILVRARESDKSASRCLGARTHRQAGRQDFGRR